MRPSPCTLLPASQRLSSGSQLPLEKARKEQGRGRPLAEPSASGTGSQPWGAENLYEREWPVVSYAGLPAFMMRRVKLRIRSSVQGHTARKWWGRSQEQRAASAAPEEGGRGRDAQAQLIAELVLGVVERRALGRVGP